MADKPLTLEQVANWVFSQIWRRSDYISQPTANGTDAFRVFKLDRDGYINAGFIDAEDISDIVGAMVAGNTETGIAVTYQDADNTLDFVLDDEYLQDTTGAMVTGNTETGISVTYNDGTGKLDFDARTAGDLRYGQLAAANTWTQANAFSTTVTATGVVTGSSGFRSSSVALADDTALDIAITSQGMLMCSTMNGASVGNRYLLAAFRSNSTPVCQAIVAGSDVETATAALLGTTGTDGKMTVSCVNGHIYIENRLGSTLGFIIFLMG